VGELARHMWMLLACPQAVGAALLPSPYSITLRKPLEMHLFNAPLARYTGLQQGRFIATFEAIIRWRRSCKSCATNAKFDDLRDLDLTRQCPLPGRSGQLRRRSPGADGRGRRIVQRLHVACSTWSSRPRLPFAARTSQLKGFPCLSTSSRPSPTTNRSAVQWTPPGTARARAGLRRIRLASDDEGLGHMAQGL